MRERDSAIYPNGHLDRAEAFLFLNPGEMYALISLIRRGWGGACCVLLPRCQILRSPSNQPCIADLVD